MSHSDPDIEYGFKSEGRGEGESSSLTHTWWLRGPKGGVHLWGTFLLNDERSSSWMDNPYGGVEVHRPHKSYDFQPDEPPIEDCWLIGGPCWPDGTSLYFSEHIKPLLEGYRDTPRKMDSFVNSEMFDFYVTHLDPSLREHSSSEFL